MYDLRGYSFLCGVLALCVTVALSSCIIIDDDNNDHDVSEQINYYNNTDFTVENFIDDQYRGSVEPHGTLTIYGDYEGTHKFESRATSGGWTWGPSYFSLHDGEVFDIFLDPPGQERGNAHKSAE